MGEWWTELLGELAWLIFLFVLFILVFIAYLAKLFWDRLGQRIQQSVVGNWYNERPLKWQAALSFVSIISLLFLFWCLCVYGVIILLGFVHVNGIVYISVLVSFPFFGFLVLGACWSISERLQREGIGKQTVQIGFPLIAFGILTLLLIAIGVAGIVLGTIFIGIVVGTTYSISMLLFVRASKLRMNLAELKDQLGRGDITQEEYEQKKELLESEKLKERIPTLSGKMKLTIIFGVIIAIIAPLFLFFPLETLIVSFVILLIGSVLSVLVTLYFGWEHPKLYVRVYTFLVAGPVALVCGCLTFIHIVYVIPAFAPLIPLWYLWYNGYRKEKDLIWWYRKHNQRTS